MKLELIQPIAEDLLAQLSSACVRIEIAGSLRRRKPEPKDIELVAIPAIGHYAVRDLFDHVVEEHPINHLEEAVLTLLDLGQWEFDPEVRRNGPAYKRLRHVPTGVCTDLFITDARKWGYTFTVRTGPGDFSKALVTYAHRLTMFFNGSLLHKHAPVYDLDGKTKDCPAGDRCLRIVETPEERDVFAALGLSWIEPPRRNRNLFDATVPRGAWTR